MSPVSVARRTPPLLLAIGFRPFFLLSVLSAFLLMAGWMGIWGYGWQLPHAEIPDRYWHGHEMLFGYGLAVIAGFLLTAVRNWTGRPTLSGLPLAGLILLWLIPRFSLPLGGLPPPITAALDAAFVALLLISVAIPIRRAGQLGRQAGILACLATLMLLNIAFYFALAGMFDDGFRWSLYGGMYAEIYLVLVIGRRIIPLFTERGVGYSVTLRNSDRLDRACALSFVLFAVVDTLQMPEWLVVPVAALTALVHGVRWVGWQTRGIWRRPLLWILHVGYAVLILALLLRSLSPWFQVGASLQFHLFAVGVIVLITFGMMARVAIGHTGRDVHRPPGLVVVVFFCLLGVLVARVGLPLLMPIHYVLWVTLAQWLWLAACGLFLWVCVPLLVAPRPDGQPG